MAAAHRGHEPAAPGVRGAQGGGDAGRAGRARALAVGATLSRAVIACWLQTQYADAAYAQQTSPSPGQHTAALKRQASSHQRYLHSIKTLATVRKLLRPALSPVDLALRPPPESRPSKPLKHPRLRRSPEALPVLN
jgi:hypothetical protein